MVDHVKISMNVQLKMFALDQMKSALMFVVVIAAHLRIVHLITQTIQLIGSKSPNSHSPQGY